MLSLSNKKPYFAAIAIFYGAFTFTAPLQAAAIYWTNWTSVTAGGPGISGSPGAATGTIPLPTGTIDVTLAGPNVGADTSPNWLPASSFSGGTVGNAPPALSTTIRTQGGFTVADTITFSSPATNPVMEIFGLGSTVTTNRFDFTAAEPFTIEAAGPSAQLGGGAITTSGNSVFGFNEANGVIQFNGTFSQLTWTNPVYGCCFDFTVGVTAPAVISGTPEPATLAISSLGITLLGALLRRRLKIGPN